MGKGMARFVIRIRCLYKHIRLSMKPVSASKVLLCENRPFVVLK